MNWLNLVGLFKLLFLIGPVVLNGSKWDSNLVLNKPAAEPIESSLARWSLRDSPAAGSGCESCPAQMGQGGPEEPGVHQNFNKFCFAHIKAQKKRPKGQMLKGKQHIRNTEICAKLPNLPFRGCWPKHRGCVSQCQLLYLHIHTSKNLFFKLLTFFL